jgi:hypothetical protein
MIKVIRTKRPIIMTASPPKTVSLRPRLEYAGTRLVTMTVELSVVELVTV